MKCALCGDRVRVTSARPAHECVINTGHCLRCDAITEVTYREPGYVGKGYNRWSLTFDEPPDLVFVQERGSNKARVFQDGKELHGVRSIDISASAGDITTHTVECITGHTQTANKPPHL